MSPAQLHRDGRLREAQRRAAPFLAEPQLREAQRRAAWAERALGGHVRRQPHVYVQGPILLFRG
jgi:hypothetical protein